MEDDMINSKKLNLIVTELFIKGKKLNILHSHILKYQKEIRVNTTHFFIQKFPIK